MTKSNLVYSNDMSGTGIYHVFGIAPLAIKLRSYFGSNTNKSVIGWNIILYES